MFVSEPVYLPNASTDSDTVSVFFFQCKLNLLSDLEVKVIKVIDLNFHVKISNIRIP